jgi:AmmeMemoRadiSam system protein A
VATAPSALSDDDQSLLLWYALAAIRSGLERRPIAGLRQPKSPALVAIGATFVTLEREEQLLGCIGTIEPVRPLYEDVMTNAYRSAFADPRLPAVTGDDFAVLDLKLSVLGPLVPMPAADRETLVTGLRPGVDGVLLSCDHRRATFLPSVWPNVTSAEEFVDLLLRKAGLADGQWPPGLAAYRYVTAEYCDPGPRDPRGPEVGPR